MRATTGHIGETRKQTRENSMSFPKIQQFRNIIENVKLRTWLAGKDENDEPIYDETKPLPVWDFTGTVKLHGTNASIKLVDGELKCYSRNRELSILSDNYGFAMFVHANRDTCAKLLQSLPSESQVYGEWCGRGINSGCGIQQLDRMFVIFDVSVGPAGGRTWLSNAEIARLSDSDARIFNIYDFTTYNVTVDFGNPGVAADTMSKLTDDVENNCPVGAHFNITPENIGEGIVWKCSQPNTRIWFKTKGEKHKITKTKAKIELSPEVLALQSEFVDAVVTDARLHQGIEFLKSEGLELSKRSTGHYIKWVIEDVLSEEADRLIACGVTKTRISAAIATKVRESFFVLLDN